MSPIAFARTMGPYQLKHWISQFGYKSQVIDFCYALSNEEILDLIDHFAGPETQVVGISTNFWPFDGVPANVVELVHIIRERYPHIKIVTGRGEGGNPTVKEKELFDMNFVGYAEDTFVEWLTQRPTPKKFDITALAHRFDESDAILPTEVLPIELGRGCMFKCKFCSYSNIGAERSTYQRKFNLILDEMQWNFDNFGTTKYAFVDDTVNEDIDKLRNLSKVKNSLGFDITWAGYIRADLLQSLPETPHLLAESGMRSCFCGIETFNPTSAKAVGKYWSAKHGQDFLPRLYDSTWGKSINLQCGFIVGLPFESETSLRSTLQWCVENKIGSHLFSTYRPHNNAISKDHSLFKYSVMDIQTSKWENEFLTSSIAEKLTQEFTQVLSATNRTAAWNMLSYLNHGVTVEQAQGQLVSQWQKLITEESLTTFKNDYIRRLKSLAK